MRLPWHRTDAPIGHGYRLPPEGFRGINVVNDGTEPVEDVPEPGGLPGAGPLGVRITLDRYLPEGTVVVVGEDRRSVVVRFPG